MARNEAGGYFRSAVKAWLDFADELLLLDNGSTDDTSSLAVEVGGDQVTEVEQPYDRPAWGHEAPFREALFNAGVEASEPGDILFILDADMAPIKSPVEFFEASDAEAFAFPLFDLWATDEMHLKNMYMREQFSYRDEPPYWVAHRNPRTWAVRVREEDLGTEHQFDDGRDIHSGHIPSSYQRTITAADRCVVPKSHAIAHYSYLDPEDQQQKYEQYMSVKADLTEFERAHAETIIEEAPRLRPLGHDMDYVLEKDD